MQEEQYKTPTGEDAGRQPMQGCLELSASAVPEAVCTHETLGWMRRADSRCLGGSCFFAPMARKGPRVIPRARCSFSLCYMYRLQRDVRVLLRLQGALRPQRPTTIKPPSPPKTVSPWPPGARRRACCGVYGRFIVQKHYTACQKAARARKWGGRLLARAAQRQAGQQRKPCGARRAAVAQLLEV